MYGGNQIPVEINNAEQCGALYVEMQNRKEITTEALADKHEDDWPLMPRSVIDCRSEIATPQLSTLLPIIQI